MIALMIGTIVALQLTSPAIKPQGEIPEKYSYDRDNVSPPLSWSSPPQGTQSFVLIVHDPDAPKGDWVHWVYYNIPPNLLGLDENVPKDAQLPDGSRQGKTDYGTIGYGGPRPPSGTHHYHFLLYALDTKLNLPPGATRRQVEEVMKGHVRGHGELVATYTHHLL